MSQETLAALRAKSFSRPLSVTPEQATDARRQYIAQLRRLGADDELVERLTGPRQPRLSWWRRWARWPR